jgi:hypothetical protein
VNEPYTPVVKTTVAAYLDAEELDMLETLRKRKGVVWSRENMMIKCLRAEYERQMALPMPADPTEPENVEAPRLGHAPFRNFRYERQTPDESITAAGGWCGPNVGYLGVELPRTPQQQQQEKIEAQAAATLEALHDVVDAVVELSDGPVTVTAEAPIVGGSTYRMTATIEFGVKPVFES